MTNLKYNPLFRKQLKKLGKNKSYLEKVFNLIEDIKVSPRYGIGKPERLKYYKRETWSRRIDQQNRLIYEIIEPDVILISCIGHYE
jgi:toxin YoeB